MSRILVVEDEAKIARFVELELTHEGYEVDKAADGRSGVDAALSGDYDLVLLDLLLPQLNGLEVLRRIRRERDVPVIVLTARDSVMDKVAGLDAGADDYVTKPFAIEELLARIRVALKRREATAGTASAADAPVAAATATTRDETGPAGDDADGSPRDPARHVLSSNGVTLDVERHEVTVAGEEVQLTNREFEVLRALMENEGMVMTRDRLLQLACGYEYAGETNAIDVYVRHIRSKIDDRFGMRLVTTVRGVGYVIREG